jgi:hypothetical protein
MESCRTRFLVVFAIIVYVRFLRMFEHLGDLSLEHLVGVSSGVRWRCELVHGVGGVRMVFFALHRAGSVVLPRGGVGALLCLLLAGDVELNPGPRQPRYPCVAECDRTHRTAECRPTAHSICGASVCRGSSSSIYDAIYAT